jgi:hypothetical protein
VAGNPVYREYNMVDKNLERPYNYYYGYKRWFGVRGRMDNDSTVLFLGRSNNGVNGDWSMDIQIIKADRQQ